MRSRFGGLVLGLLIGLVGILALALAPAVDLEEDLGLGWLFKLRGPVDAPGDVIIIAIDEPSAQHLGLPNTPRDWPRSLHAELVRYLAKAGARVISFDLTFETPAAQPANDQEFAEAIGLAGNVLISNTLRMETISLPGASVLIDKAESPPIAVLEQVALAHAPFLLPKSSRVNWYWTFKSGEPMLPLLAAHFFASNAIDDFLALLHKVEPHVSVPQGASDPPMSVPERGLNRVRAMRERVIKLPHSRERMLQQLADTPDSDLPPDRRRFIKLLVNLYSSSEDSYLNFYGPPRSIKTVSYFQLLEAARSVDPAAAEGPNAELFRNTAVFVGFSAAEAGEDRVHDDYRTVYSQPNGHDISGVEIQATAFANLLDGRQLRRATEIWQFTIVFAWGLVLGMVCRGMRPIRAVAAVAVLATVFLWVVYRQFVDEAVWWPSIIPVGIQAPLALFAGVWFNYQDTQQEREAVKRAFGQFLPSAVVEKLARNVGPITAANRVVFGVCLATDGEKYTTLAERMGPAKLGQFMNEYYADLFVPVERSGGVVMDVIGDAMVAIWAGTMSDADLRINACESALEIIETLDQPNRMDRGKPMLPTRLALHSGEMLIGTVGASRHYEYRAVGDIVNTASRIEGLNKTLGTRLLATEATVAGLDRFATRPLGSFLLAGKVTPVSVVELLGRKQDIGARLFTFCEMFASALDAYSTGLWREAADRFADVLRSMPEDGPARFYQQRCEFLLMHHPGAGWTPTIRVDAK